MAGDGPPRRCATLYRPRLSLRAPLRRAVLGVALCLSAGTAAAERGGDAGTAEAPAGSPSVAVASSLRAVWPALERAWRERLPAVGARPSFGASRTLARQIARGAPFELFLSADEESPSSLPVGRVHPGSGATYARGRLALVLSGGLTAGAGRAIEDGTLEPLAARLAEVPRLRLAIANPVHAPYGIAAREALEASGLWPWPEGRLVIGENASQTLQFLRSGAVEAALVPLSLLAAGRGADGLGALSVRPVDERLHAPLDHRLVALAGASPAALALAEWLRGGRARDILLAAGFGDPS